MNSIEKIVLKCTLKMAGGKVYYQGEEVFPPLPSDLIEEINARPEIFDVFETKSLIKKYEDAKERRRQKIKKETDPVKKWRFLSKEGTANAPSFKQFVQESLEQIRGMDADEKAKVIEKWRRFYPDEECPI